MPKILLVEDDEMNRDMLSRRLARNGYDVTTPKTASSPVICSVYERCEID